MKYGTIGHTGVSGMMSRAAFSAALTASMMSNTSKIVTTEAAEPNTSEPIEFGTGATASTMLRRAKHAPKLNKAQKKAQKKQRQKENLANS